MNSDNFYDVTNLYYVTNFFLYDITNHYFITPFLYDTTNLYYVTPFLYDVTNLYYVTNPVCSLPRVAVADLTINEMEKKNIAITSLVAPGVCPSHVVTPMTSLTPLL